MIVIIIFVKLNIIHSIDFKNVLVLGLLIISRPEASQGLTKGYLVDDLGFFYYYLFHRITIVFCFISFFTQMKAAAVIQTLQYLMSIAVTTGNPQSQIVRRATVQMQKSIPVQQLLHLLFLKH